MFADIGDYIEIFLRSQTAFAPVLLLTLEESGFPVPIPGDIVIAYVGYQVAQGHLSYNAAFFILLTAVLTGSSILFFLSRKYGNKLVARFGPYLHINEKKLRTVEKKFKKYGPWVIIIGRHVPGFRIPITIFSGMSGIRFRTFFLSTLVSIIFWIPFNLELGARLGPRTAKLFQGHSEFFYIATIPFLLFLSYVVFLKFKSRHKVVKH